SSLSLLASTSRGGALTLAPSPEMMPPREFSNATRGDDAAMFEGKAEEAMNLYVSLFGGEGTSIERYGPGELGAERTVKRAESTLAAHGLSCIDSPARHAFTFTPSASLFVECADEAELGAAFARLSEGGAVLMPPGDYGFSRKFAWVS